MTNLEPLRVELREFCHQFSTTLQPFAESLDNGLRILRRLEDGEEIQPVLNALLDNRHRLKILQDKARQQHAYLVIFGPLKSGKSTLMNAISGSYVSEVSSLPAYPCLVYVHEGEERRFATTNFNGEETLYSSPRTLNESVQSAHEVLARKLREADETGAPFNPAEEYKEAIRRIDFTLPAPYLRESGTILVDTPGLYAKMKYNYGQLTRDFRDTAACAVFVVKTDNLFFERVFEEFADLLDVFSRVFLVVNIDSRKQDLGPDGELVPSLEQQQPEKVIEAFENLTVSAQIRSAIENGQLRIYAIDLLDTARQSLQQEDSTASKEESGGEDVGKEETAPSAEEEEQSGEEKEDVDSAASGSVRSLDAPTDGEATIMSSVGAAKVGFPAFLKDLTDYLNSSDYLLEFMGDSLRQTHSILREIEEQTASPKLTGYREGIEELKETAERSERQLREVKQIQEDSWESPLDELARELRQQAQEHTGSVIPSLKESVHGEIDIWSFSEESLRDLLENRIQPLIRKACKESRARARELIDGACGGRNGGIRLSTELVGRMHGVGLQFDDIYPDFREEVEKTFANSPALPDPENVQETIPVRKTFFDYLLFRTPNRVRRHLFGEEVPSAKSIPAAAKSRRFGEEGKSALYETADRHIEQCFDSLVIKEVDELLQRYRDFFRRQTADRLEQKAQELEETGNAARRRYEDRRSVIEAMEALDAASDQLKSEVEFLRQRFLAGKLPELEGEEASETESETETVAETDTETGLDADNEQESGSGDQSEAEEDFDFDFDFDADRDKKE